MHAEEREESKVSICLSACPHSFSQTKANLRKYSRSLWARCLWKTNFSLYVEAAECEIFEIWLSLVEKLLAEGHFVNASRVSLVLINLISASRCGFNEKFNTVFQTAYCALIGEEHGFATAGLFIIACNFMHSVESKTACNVQSELAT